MSSSARLFQSESSALTENMDLDASCGGGGGADDDGDFDHYIDGIDNVGMDLNNIVDLVSPLILRKAIRTSDHIKICARYKVLPRLRNLLQILISKFWSGFLGNHNWSANIWSSTLSPNSRINSCSQDFYLVVGIIPLDNPPTVMNHVEPLMDYVYTHLFPLYLVLRLEPVKDLLLQLHLIFLRAFGGDLSWYFGIRWHIGRVMDLLIVQRFRVRHGLSCVIGPEWLAATLRQRCPCLSRNRCKQDPSW